MKQISKKVSTVIERAYDTQKECEIDEEEMTSKYFEVVSGHHDIYLYYRKYQKEIEFILE